eukprot:TRINITY_DN12584_c0_g2_i1.p2 TRINITY_DN12584_c0_g2~~TRINITY_DN12584_c0_g2_i1.p2  ORF type:complete len:101 (-),score=12.19 TRINITY_DN12584_c0_g2_i1:71-373(-)
MRVHASSSPIIVLFIISQFTHLLAMNQNFVRQPPSIDKDIVLTPPPMDPSIVQQPTLVPPNFPQAGNYFENKNPSSEICKEESSGERISGVEKAHQVRAA